ncbi:MAG: hypothetical protein COV30_02140 [Candidatus Yanofskybacteria bacterium CG10_big_fil_rev_8_21_14_0_10_37_15]|uniref:Glycosyl transferase family 1 domain-containing protein n=1 Tax=Candidatus Yanofskybacteria bacterium CG10_big_fil_rev_8_21_14_0_10_37_15 TaxID=1975097 RepID=A0A2H0R6T7_9BACT|nr:MAG: hypothetical protein COV30_02140 [Candidatus Yanofskybacteria bacterium CG10_big_fil_rev_8_21_14_0_10_37_15]
MIKIGIECESIEGKNHMFGVGRIITKLLQEISMRPELKKKFSFVLYFKDSVPDFEFLNAPIFEKKTISVPFFKNRLFPVYYFLFLPIKLWFERPNLMFWPNYMLPIITFNKSIVMLTEDIYHETHFGKLPFRYRLAYGIFGWWTAKFATKILAISETSKKNIAKLYNIDANRIAVNYLGIDFKSESEKLSFTKTSETQQTKGDYVLFVGQAFPRRHLKETILAFEKIAGNFPKLKFIAVGPDKYETPTIDRLVFEVNDRLGREAIIHKNYVEDRELVELYTRAKALVYVSDREAFGLPPLEALSFGVPPIVMDNKLGHELFEGYAFYSKSGEVDDIVEAIKQVLNEVGPFESFRTSRLEFVKKYNWKSFSNKFLEILSR